MEQLTQLSWPPIVLPEINTFSGYVGCGNKNRRQHDAVHEMPNYFIAHLDILCTSSVVWSEIIKLHFCKCIIPYPETIHSQNSSIVWRTISRLPRGHKNEPTERSAGG